MNRRKTLAALLGATAAGAPLSLALAYARQTADAKAPGDYMSASLRGRVENLKAGLAAEPTGDRNGRDRSLVLYDWMNAAALVGLPTHPDLPATIAQIHTPNFLQRGDRQRLATYAVLDRHVRTLAALDANPAVCGTVRVTTPGPFVVDSYVQFEQTYTVGDAPILQGGGVIIPNHFYFVSEQLQASDPAADNYLTLRCSNASVRFAVDAFPVTGMFSSRLSVGESDRVFFQVAEGRLQPGDVVTVRYGDRSGGSRGLKLIHVSNSALRFPLWLLTEPDGLLLTPREAAIAAVGGPAAGVHAFAPSVVEVGEPFAISVRAEDKFRNLATGGAPGWVLTLNDRPFRRLAPSPQAIHVIEGVRLETAGVYRLEVRSEDGAIRGQSDPILVEAAPGERIYWGETHGHCGFSEGMGLVDDYFAFARDEARLDFTTLSEHDLWLDAGEWEQMRTATRKFDRPGEFIAFMGYEWTVVSAFGGHHNVIFRDIDGVRPVTCQRHPNLPDLYAGLRKGYAPKDVMVIPHAHMTADATQNDPELEPLVEIVSEHGTFEWLGRRYLANGFELGFVGASDDHIGHPGYKPRPLGRFYFDGYGGLAAVYAPAKTRNELFDAMKARRTYATNGARIILRAQINGRRMGEVVPSSRRRVIEGVVHGTGPIESITLVKNGVDLRALEYDAAERNGPSDLDIVEVRFRSSSDPGAPLVPARSIRTWTGRIVVGGAELADVSSPQAEAMNRLTEWARPRLASRNEADFRLVTRGDAKAIRLRLDGDLSKARVRIILEGTEAPFDVVLPVPAPGEPPARAISLQEMAASGNRAAGRFEDDVLVRRIRPVAERDRRFRFEDADRPEDGDNYYVRVVQADGGAAWTSPAWVGRVKRRKT
jgi:hypothetical protein